MSLPDETPVCELLLKLAMLTACVILLETPTNICRVRNGFASTHEDHYIQASLLSSSACTPVKIMHADLTQSHNTFAWPKLLGSVSSQKQAHITAYDLELRQAVALQCKRSPVSWQASGILVMQ